MDTNKLFILFVQVGILAIFVSSLLEVIKGISAVGVLGLLKELWSTLINNKNINQSSFPVLNFAVALLLCWAFDITIMKQLFTSIRGDRLHEPFTSWMDYFGTASVVYAGADQFFKRVLATEKLVTSTVTEIKKDQETLGVQQVKGQNTTTTTTSVTGTTDEKVSDSVDNKQG